MALPPSNAVTSGEEEESLLSKRFLSSYPCRFLKNIICGL
jgi:hypothetical protein